MVAIINYGVGNLFSLKSSFAFIGEEAVVTADEKVLREADRLILPGVGAFADAAAKLRESGLDKIVKELAADGKPLLGICLGMQMLFDKSLEYGEHEGLGLVSGIVEPIKPVIPEDYKVPHIGWNRLKFYNDSPIFKYLNEGDCVYFVHSYAAAHCEANTTATTEYGAELTASVQNGNVFGTQFHPEKSGKTGLAILKAYCEI